MKFYYVIRFINDESIDFFKTRERFISELKLSSQNVPFEHRRCFHFEKMCLLLVFLFEKKKQSKFSVRRIIILLLY